VLGYLALLGLFLLLFSLCFFYGIREWLRPRDATPLPVDADYVRAENYFGASFREKMREWLKTARPLPLPETCSEFLRTVLEKPEGGKILVMAEDCLLDTNTDAGTSASKGAGEIGDTIYCEGALRLAPGTAVRGEIYALGNVQSGAGARILALASDGAVLLGADNEVAHWVDAQGTILVGPGTVAGGRLSSMESIELEPGVTVESLYAPLILTSGYSGEDTGVETAGNRAPGETEEERVAEKNAENRAGPGGVRGTAEASGQKGAIGGATSVPLSPETEMVRGNLELPDGARVKGSLVVQGTLRSGDGARFGGSIKASRVEMGARNSVRGNVVSGSTLRVGEGSRVAGSVVADSDILLRRGARVGAEKKEAVVSAGRDVTLEKNVAVRGKIAAGRAIVTV
jgi:hypothetical protein